MNSLREKVRKIIHDSYSSDPTFDELEEAVDKDTDELLALPEIKEMQEKAEKWDILNLFTGKPNGVDEVISKAEKWEKWGHLCQQTHDDLAQRQLDLILKGLVVEERTGDCIEGHSVCGVCTDKTTRLPTAKEVREFIGCLLKPYTKFTLKSGAILRMEGK